MLLREKKDEDAARSKNISPLGQVKRESTASQEGMLNGPGRRSRAGVWRGRQRCGMSKGQEDRRAVHSITGELDSADPAAAKKKQNPQSVRLKMQQLSVAKSQTTTGLRDLSLSVQSISGSLRCTSPARAGEDEAAARLSCLRTAPEGATSRLAPPRTSKGADRGCPELPPHRFYVRHEVDMSVSD